jgi:hypothetical protein
MSLTKQTMRKPSVDVDCLLFTVNFLAIEHGADKQLPITNKQSEIRR